MKINQAYLVMLSKRSLYCDYRFNFDKDRMLRAYTICIFSALSHCIKSWAAYNSSFLNHSYLPSRAYNMKGCVVHRGIKKVGREPSWQRPNSVCYQPHALFLIPN